MGLKPLGLVMYAGLCRHMKWLPSVHKVELSVESRILNLYLLYQDGPLPVFQRFAHSCTPIVEVGPIRAPVVANGGCLRFSALDRASGAMLEWHTLHCAVGVRQQL